MSKSITIQEGGVGKALTNVKKLKTAKQGGGNVFWVPEEEVQLTTKHISKNGTYKASSDNAYGYSQVTVSGIGKATGIKPGSGTPISQGGNGKDNEYAYVTPQGGGGGGSDDNIIEKLLPSSIKIITPPSQTEYTDGEDISISGMVVTAYNNDGTVWTDQDHPSGHVGLSELAIDPTKADSSGISDVVIIPDEEVIAHYGHGVGTPARSATVTMKYKPTGVITDGYVRTSGSGDIFVYIIDQSATAYFCAVSEKPFTVSYYSALYNEEKIATARLNENSYFGGNYYAVGWTSIGYTGYTDWETTVTPSFSRNGWWLPTKMTEVGDLTFHNSTIKGGGQEITVTWKRPEDEKELSDKFSITVNPDIEGGGGTDSGGGSW